MQIQWKKNQKNKKDRVKEKPKKTKTRKLQDKVFATCGIVEAHRYPFSQALLYTVCSCTRTRGTVFGIQSTYYITHYSRLDWIHKVVMELGWSRHGMSKEDLMGLCQCGTVWNSLCGNSKWTSSIDLGREKKLSVESFNGLGRLSMFLVFCC